MLFWSNMSSQYPGEVSQRRGCKTGGGVGICWGEPSPSGPLIRILVPLFHLRPLPIIFTDLILFSSSQSTNTYFRPFKLSGRTWQWIGMGASLALYKICVSAKIFIQDAPFIFEPPTFSLFGLTSRPFPIFDGKLPNAVAFHATPQSMTIHLCKFTFDSTVLHPRRC